MNYNLKEGHLVEHIQKIKDLLEQVKECVCEDRNQEYGPPQESFDRIAAFWTTHLQNQGIDVELDAIDVAHMMILFKVARNTYKQGADNAVDICGYGALAGVLEAKGG